MMRVSIICFSLLLLVLAGFGIAENPQLPIQITNDLYWISYQTTDSTNTKVVTFLMQIDSTGKVVRAPEQVSGGLTISQHGANQINLWDCCAAGERAVIDKGTLNVVKTVQTNIEDVSYATQKAHGNFVTYTYSDSYKPSLKFFRVSPTGVPSGATWVMTSENGSECEFLQSICPSGAISSDGRTVLWFVNGFFGSSLSIQPLKRSGKPDGSERFVTEGGSRLYGGAVSNVLPDGRVFVVYVANGGDAALPQLFLQAVDRQTGKKAGDSILLKKRFKPDYYSATLVIDPSAHFIVYRSGKRKAGSLRFQALDATGHPSGKATLLVKLTGSPSGISLLKD